MNPSSESLNKALSFMIQVVTNRSDGVDYVPVVLHLERQIAALMSTDTEYERIIRLAKNS